MHTDFKRDHPLHTSGNSNSTLPFYKEINKFQDFYGQLLKSTFNSKQITLKPYSRHKPRDLPATEATPHYTVSKKMFSPSSRHPDTFLEHQASLE